MFGIKGGSECTADLLWLSSRSILLVHLLRTVLQSVVTALCRCSDAGFELLALLVPIKTHMFLLAYIFYRSFYSTNSGKGVQVYLQLYFLQGKRVLQNSDIGGI